MANKKNLPNIPLYIGDWEKDCNVLDIASEGAWLRIVFKLWTKGKQNTIKIPTKSLQKLWRCSEEQMREILDDLIFNEIAEIEEIAGFVEFTCRRFVKENELSRTRSKARSEGYLKNKNKSKDNQKNNKNLQNTDNDIDYDNVNDINTDFEEINSAYEFLKNKIPSRMEVFEMQNKSSFENYETFIVNFNGKVITEGLDYDQQVLYARLEMLNANWSKELKNKQKIVTNR